MPQERKRDAIYLLLSAADRQRWEACRDYIRRLSVDGESPGNQRVLRWLLRLVDECVLQREKIEPVQEMSNDDETVR